MDEPCYPTHLCNLFGVAPPIVPAEDEHLPDQPPGEHHELVHAPAVEAEPLAAEGHKAATAFNRIRAFACRRDKILYYLMKFIAGFLSLPKMWTIPEMRSAKSSWVSI